MQSPDGRRPARCWCFRCGDHTYLARSVPNVRRQCTVNLANGATATTNYPTYLDTTLAGSEGPAYTFEQHTITWNGCTPSPTCSGAVSFSYYAQATNSGSYTIKISMTGTGTWDNGAIHYSVTGGYAEVDISGQKSSSAAILD